MRVGFTKVDVVAIPDCRQCCYGEVKTVEKRPSLAVNVEQNSSQKVDSQDDHTYEE